jgi:hypothetical protein
MRRLTMGDGTFAGALAAEVGRWKSDAAAAAAWARTGRGRLVLHSAVDLVKLLPGANDSPLTLATKALAALATVDKATSAGSAAYGATKARITREAVPLFELPPNYLHELVLEGPSAGDYTVVELAREGESAPRRLLRASHVSGAHELFFEIEVLGSVRTAWLRGVTVRQLIAPLWEQHGGALHAESRNALKYNASYGQVENLSLPTVRALSTDGGALYGETRAQADAWCERLKASLGDGTARSYLVCGPPGTGKSTAAHSVARALGLRLLRVGARLATCDRVACRQLVDGLQPDVLLLDDFDRAFAPDASVAKPGSSVAFDVSDILSWLTDLRAQGVTVVMTANDVTHFPAALLRPGRVDEILYFGLPSPADRETVLLGYGRALGVDLPSGVLAALVAATEGEPEATLRYVVESLRHGRLSDVLGLLDVRRRVLSGEAR